MDAPGIIDAFDQILIHHRLHGQDIVDIHPGGNFSSCVLISFTCHFSKSAMTVLKHRPFHLLSVDRPDSLAILMENF